MRSRKQNIRLHSFLLRISGVRSTSFPFTQRERERERERETKDRKRGRCENPVFSAISPLDRSNPNASFHCSCIRSKLSIFMEGVSGGASDASVNPLAKWRIEFSRSFQYYLDRSTPQPVGRWLGTAALALIYALRCYYLKGFYIVSYALGIYLLNLLIGFLSPKADPELEVMDGPSLPTKGSDEFKPFIRRLPEFKFWYSTTKAFCIAFCMTFFSMFDVPVFWPILLCYWIVLFVLTMKRQILHMIKYKYVPFSIGKQRYGRKKSSAGSSSLSRD